jgi:hypothetical protein
MIFDGMSPRLAEQAAKNNLALRKIDLDAELQEALDRDRLALDRRLVRLLEDAEAQGLIPPGDSTGA